MRSNRMITRHSSLAAVVTLTVTVALTALGGCSSSVSTTPTGAPTTATAGRDHAIRVFAQQPDGTSTLLKFGPGTEVRFGGAAARPAASRSGTTPADVSGASLHLDGVNGEAGTPIQAPPTIESPLTDPWSTAWALAWRAAGQCGIDQTDMAGYPIAFPPWYVANDQRASWYLYPGGSSSCADRLQIEQNLVCVADKLAAVADAVGTIVWPALNPKESPLPYSVGENGSLVRSLAHAEWHIPPQADEDRFIVRDLAIHTLAMVPTVDAYTDIAYPSSMPAGATCAQAFAWLANPANTTGTQNTVNGCLVTPISVAMFGYNSTYGNVNPGYVPAFPPSAAPICDAAGNNNAPAIAQSALNIEAQILRSSGRLLHDLVRRDVYSDMASAARSSAQSMDPVLGNQSAWGASSKGPYGSIAHAARVLLGRWEIGDAADFGTVADPQCEGTTEMSLVPGALGDELSARVLDRPIRTPGEQTAVQLVERSGIVVPSCQLGNAAALRQALIDQLLYGEQLQNHLAAPPPAAALTQVVAPLADDEIVFAFTRALRTWRLLTNTPDTTGGSGAQGADGGSCVAVGDATGATPLPAGLVLATDALGKPAIAASVGALSGVVVQGGLGRARLATDPIARAGGMMSASQCPLSNPYWSEWGLDGQATMQTAYNVPPSGLAQPPQAELPPGVFQDAFHVGQALERRLNLLQSATQGLSDSNPAAVAVGGIAELRAWAGSTIVHAWSLGNATRTLTSLVVRVGGMSYANDFGIPPGAPLTAVQNAFGFVYGPPWVAECAAGVRPDCPANFAQNYVQLATAVTDVTGAYPATGVLDNVFQLTVPLTGGATMFQPALEAGAPHESRLYMVRLHDPKGPLGRGRVLGTIPLGGRWVASFFGGKVTWAWVSGIYGFVDAPMQRELVHAALDLGRWVGAKPPALGDPSAAQTSGYCVDGVPRDLFVPLDNELVSGSQTYEDSWQHYLDLALQAAQTADTLGQQLIADDLRISENKQAAEQQLANICGDFGALSTAKVQSNGTITAGSEDPTTQECLSEPTTDVVFLGALPPSIPTSGDPTCAIKAAIHCAAADMPGCPPPPPSTTPGSAVALCKRPKLTAGHLDIVQPASTAVPAPGGGPSVSAACQDILTNVAPSLRTGLLAQQYLQDLGDPSLAPNALQAAVSQLHMTVDLQNNWHVKYGDQLIMDSQNKDFWPGCIGNTGCAGSAIEKLMAPGWSAVFRDCPAAKNDTQTYPLGCDGSPAAELNLIKWRVMQALWMMGASAGGIPAGMITQPIPAVFTDWCTSGCVTHDLGLPDAALPTDLWAHGARAV